MAEALVRIQASPDRFDGSDADAVAVLALKSGVAAKIGFAVAFRATTASPDRFDGSDARCSCRFGT